MFLLFHSTRKLDISEVDITVFIRIACLQSLVFHALIMHSFLTSSRDKMDLFSSCNHRTAAGAGRGDPSGWGRTGRTGRTAIEVSQCFDGMEVAL
jgi:hypothetical protein